MIFNDHVLLYSLKYVYYGLVNCYILLNTFTTT